MKIAGASARSGFKLLFLNLLISFVLLIFSIPQAYAKAGDFSFDLLPGFGFGPKDKDTDIDFDTEFGGGAGVGFQISDNFQLRTDVTVFKWEGSDTTKSDGGIFFGTITVETNEEIRVTPIFLGGRYFLLDGPTLRPFVELGLSLNFLDAKGSVAVSSSLLGVLGSVSASESKMLIGFAPGIGVEALATPHIGYGINFRYNYVGKDIGDFEGLDASFFSGLAFLSLYL